MTKIDKIMYDRKIHCPKMKSQIDHHTGFKIQGSISGKSLSKLLHNQTQNSNFPTPSCLIIMVAQVPGRVFRISML